MDDLKTIELRIICQCVDVFVCVCTLSALRAT